MSVVTTLGSFADSDVARRRPVGGGGGARMDEVVSDDVEDTGEAAPSGRRP